jgi:hypothetical protein
MTGQTKLIVYVAGGLLAVVLGYFFLVSPGLNHVAELTTQEAATRAEVLRLEKQILAYRTAQSDLAKASNKGLLDETILNDKNLYLVIQELEAGSEATGSDHELKIEREFLDTPLPATPKSKVTTQTDLEEVPYTISAQNPSYLGFINFMEYLEHLPHYTEVSSIDLSYQTLDGGGKELTGVIKGVFLAKPNEPGNQSPQN